MGTFFDDASLVMIPSGVKEDKLYSIKPTDGSGDFTFSRGSDIQCTRENSSGLIEKAKVNNLLQSNSFDTTWTLVSASVTGGQSGYDGSSDAWLLASTGTNARLVQSISQTGVQTFSIYAKKGSWDFVRLLGLDNSTNPDVFFDLSNGSLGTIDAAAIDASIEDVGGGWYRCSMVHSASITEFRIYPAFADADTTTSGGDVYIQDAALCHGLVAQDYVETTTTAVVEGLTADLPRLDYSGGASCPSLLLEPSRTNLVTLSEYIGGWSGTNTLVVNNDTTSPEGVINAAEIESTSASGGHYIGSPNFSMTSGTDYSGSLFVKSGTGRYFQLFFGGVSFTSVGYANFDLQEGVVTAEGSAVTGSIEPYGNDWYRVTISGTSAATGTATLYAGIITSGTAPRVQSHTSVLSYYIWGGQTEAGSYQTSYIPTYGTAANRGQDAASKTGISSLIGQTEGTLFVELNANVNIADGSRAIALGDGSFSNRIILNCSTSGTVEIYVISGGSISYNFVTDVVFNQANKLALAYKANDLAFYANGVLKASTSSVSIPTCSNLYIGTPEGAFTAPVNNRYSQALLFKTRLTNAELAALTTI